MTPKYEERRRRERAALTERTDQIRDALVNARSEDELHRLDIPVALLEEALLLLLRREQRRLSYTPDIVIVVCNGVVQECFSQEPEMTYKTLDEDTYEVDAGCILADEVDDIEKEIQARLHNQDDGEVE